MKRLKIIFILCLLLAFSSSGSAGATDKRITASMFKEVKSQAPRRSANGLNHVPGEVLVMLKPPASADSLTRNRDDAEIQAFSGRFGMTKKRVVNKSTVLLKIQDGEDVAAKVARLERDPNVEHVQPNYRYQLTVNPEDDAMFRRSWALQNIGQVVNGTRGVAGADIKATVAWKVSDGGDNPVIVAVIDSGVAYNHPDLRENMWDGSSGCRDEQGIPIAEGCPNHGWDFDENGGAGPDNDPSPGGIVVDPSSGARTYAYEPHGTHVAGIIAACDNSIGMIGVAPKARIMAVKTADLTTEAIIKGIAFARNNGAKVINASWGGFFDDPLLTMAIRNFRGLFIAAAGNYGYPADAFNPCSTNSENVVCVGATDQSDSMALWSNYGRSVDIAAPGSNILSTIPKENLLENTFEKVELPGLPEVLTASPDSGWHSEDISYQNLGLWTSGMQFGKVVFADSRKPYSANSNATLTLKSYDLSDALLAGVSFSTGCDTPYDELNWTDYMVLEGSGDSGLTWQEIVRWDKATLAYIKKDPFPVGRFSRYLPQSLLTSTCELRFRWVTDDHDNDGDGCFIDELKLVSYTRGKTGTYTYWDGTSMAAPHVAGAAAVLWGTNRSLSTSAIKKIILTTGDHLENLKGKIATSRRINLEKAVMAASDNGPPTVKTLGNGRKLFSIPAKGCAGIYLSEPIDSASRTRVKRAISNSLRASGFKGRVVFIWGKDYSALGISNIGSVDAVFRKDVTAIVADFLGNSAGVKLINTWDQ